jgi:hypothetical protein
MAFKIHQAFLTDINELKNNKRINKTVVSKEKWLAIADQQQDSFMWRFNLRKLNAMKIKEQYQFVISNRFPALVNLDLNVNISRFGKMLGIIEFELKRIWVIMN